MSAAGQIVRANRLPSKPRNDDATVIIERVHLRSKQACTSEIKFYWNLQKAITIPNQRV